MASTLRHRDQRHAEADHHHVHVEPASPLARQQQQQQPPGPGGEAADVAMASRGHTQAWVTAATWYSACYLLTGSTLAIMGQVVTNQGAASPQAQIVAWTKYACTALLAWLVHSASSKRGSSTLVHPKRRAVAMLIGWVRRQPTARAWLHVPSLAANP